MFTFPFWNTFDHSWRVSVVDLLTQKCNWSFRVIFGRAPLTLRFGHSCRSSFKLSFRMVSSPIVLCGSILDLACLRRSGHGRLHRNQPESHTLFYSELSLGSSVAQANRNQPLYWLSVILRLILPMGDFFGCIMKNNFLRLGFKDWMFFSRSRSVNSRVNLVTYYLLKIQGKDL